MNATFVHNPQAAEKARILAEALPYIQRFHGRTIVVKYGGNAMIEDELKQSFAHDVVLLKLVGMNPVIVHGGGPQTDGQLVRVGKEGEFGQGLGVTGARTPELVAMGLRGPGQKEGGAPMHPRGGQGGGAPGPAG